MLYSVTAVVGVCNCSSYITVKQVCRLRSHQPEIVLPDSDEAVSKTHKIKMLVFHKIAIRTGYLLLRVPQEIPREFPKKFQKKFQFLFDLDF